jgi:transposase
VRDAEWIADLLAHGLIRSSFVPPAHVQELRDLTRTRKQLVRERGRHVQRLQKVLEDANLKLASVITALLGRSGRAMLEAVDRGQSDPGQLVGLAHPRIKASRAELFEALTGRARSTTASCCVCTWARSMRSTPRSPLWRGGSRRHLPLSLRHRATRDHARGQRHGGRRNHR